jgi:hypothetical protein
MLQPCRDGVAGDRHGQFERTRELTLASFEPMVLFAPPRGARGGNLKW